MANVAKFYGMTRLAAESGIRRESLYKSLRVGGHPHYTTMKKIFDTLGMTLQVIIKKDEDEK